MSYNDDPDNTHELVQRLIVSKINEASQTPSAASSGQGNQPWKITGKIQGKSWTFSGIIMINISLQLEMMLKCLTEVIIVTLLNPCYRESSHHYKLSCDPSSHTILSWTHLNISRFLSNVDLSLSPNKVQPSKSTSEHLYRAARIIQTWH
jgi:hypothetical protein